MGGNNKEISFNKSINNKNSVKSNNNLDVVITKLMDKYNISESEAEVILEKNKKKKLQANKKSHTNQNEISAPKPQSSNGDIDSNQELRSNEKENNEANDSAPDFPIESANSDKVNIEPDVTDEDNNIQNNDFQKQNSDDSTVDASESQDVDSIISDIIPDYKDEISIELQKVNLIFDVVSDKVDTLKEVFIRTLKRNKPKKVKFHVLKDISFKMYKGDKIGIIGYNGAGKSTLLKVITGIYPPDSGKVITSGKISPLLSLGAGFDQNYSGRKNIYLNGAVLGYDKEFLEEKEQEIIEFSELGDFIDIPIKNYSSGMLAKLGFSIATIVNPDILIIDEILGVGDVNFLRKSTDKIRSLMDGGTTVLLVSHSIPQIREICDKAIWIDNGEVREIGEVNKVCDNYLEDSQNASKKQLKNILFK